MHYLVRLQTGVRDVLLLALTAHGYITVEALTHSPLLPLCHPIVYWYRIIASGCVTKLTKSVWNCYVLSG